MNENIESRAGALFSSDFLYPVSLFCSFNSWKYTRNLDMNFRWGNSFQSYLFYETKGRKIC